MPIYEYRCDSCEATIEKRQKFSEPPLTTCEICGGRLQRLISAPGLQFKGSGWYITDYARGGGGDKNGSKKAESSKGDSAGKTESTKREPKTAKPAATVSKSD